jgi:hypothetical protein
MAGGFGEQKASGSWYLDHSKRRRSGRVELFLRTGMVAAKMSDRDALADKSGDSYSSRRGH